MGLAGSIDFHLKSKKKTFSLLIYSYLRNHCPKKHYWIFERGKLIIHSPPVSLGKAEVMGGLRWDAVTSNWYQAYLCKTHSTKFIQTGNFQSLFRRLQKCIPAVDSLLTMLAFLGLMVFVVQSFSRVWLFATPWAAARHPSLSFSISRSLLKLFELVMPSNHLILSHPLLLLPPVFPSISVFSNLHSFAQWGFVPYPVFFSCVSISLKMMELCKIT